MARLSDNYYHRKYYLERDEVPTQSVMKAKMSTALAEVYFKSMNPHLKVIAGLHPRIPGGGTEWYMPPEELLAGRAVLKPISREQLEEFSSDGLLSLGKNLKHSYYKHMAKQFKQSLQQNDTDWRNNIMKSNDEAYLEFSKRESKNNTDKLLKAVWQFENVCRTSLTNLEDKVRMAAAKEIERIREDAHQYMTKRLAQLVKAQSTQMYDEYENKLNEHKEKAKSNFIEELKKIKLNTANQIHDANYDKHLSIEKLRHFLHCKSLACQVYVAFKEKEACENEMELSKREHKKNVRCLKEEILSKDEEIKREEELKITRDKLNSIWKKKVCHVVKKFQLFVEYCLQQMPEYAEFFVNMEKLMFLQLSAVIENSDVECDVITTPLEPNFKTPELMPIPFYLVYDKGFKPEIHRDLCPKRVTSSPSHFPVMIINRKNIYSACDKFEVFPDKVVEFITRNIKEDTEDDDIYDLMVPKKHTSTMQLAEIRQESSMMQALQQELTNIRDLPVNCPGCKLPYCFCKPKDGIPKMTSFTTSQTIYTTLPRKLESMTNSTELQMRREPKWESYCEYLACADCKCRKTVKKPLYEHLPPYMKKMSPYGPPELPNYETCDLETLKALVKEANKIRPQILEEEAKAPMFKDASTQYSDHAFDALCTSLSDGKLRKFITALSESRNKTVTDEAPFKLVDGSLSHASLSKTASSFATARARSLRNLLESNSDLEEIFQKKSCDFSDLFFD